MVEEIPYSHRENAFPEVKDCDKTPEPSQAFAMDQGDPGSMFHHYPMDWPYSHPSSSMHMHEGSASSVPDGTFIPPHSQYTFFTPVYPYCGPGSLDSNMDFSQQPAASDAYCGYYPDYFANYFHYNGQNPDWQADTSPDPSKSDVNQDSAAKVEDKLQVKNLVCVAPGVYRRS